MPEYKNNSNMDKGIENAPKLEDLDITQFYNPRNEKMNYGGSVTINEFDKMKLCDHICKLEDIDLQKKILSNLKIAIDDIINILN
jgi:hypothetical protein